MHSQQHEHIQRGSGDEERRRLVGFAEQTKLRREDDEVQGGDGKTRSHVRHIHVVNGSVSINVRLAVAIFERRRHHRQRSQIRSNLEGDREQGVADPRPHDPDHRRLFNDRRRPENDRQEESVCDEKSGVSQDERVGVD